MDDHANLWHCLGVRVNRLLSYILAVAQFGTFTLNISLVLMVGLAFRLLVGPQGSTHTAVGERRKVRCTGKTPLVGKASKATTDRYVQRLSLKPNNESESHSRSAARRWEARLCA